MRIIWWTSGGPLSPFGYGRVTAHMVPQLERLGHETHVLATMGNRWLTGEVEQWKLLANPTGNMDPDFLLWYAERLEADAVIWHADSWTTAPVLGQVVDQVPMILYSPIDHAPIVQREIDLFSKARATAVPSQWGVDRVREAGVERVHYVPHGVDLDLHRPVTPEIRAELRRNMEWDPDAFVFLSVAANTGTRKNLPNLLRAFSELPEEIDGRPLRLAMHTFPFRDARNEAGTNLGALAEHLGVYDRIYWADPWQYLRGFPEEAVAQLYQASDVHVMPSKTEGFGLPIIEAGACGLPSIVTDYAAMAELVTPDRGWLVDVADMDVEQLLDYAWWAIPSTDDLTMTMGHAAEGLHLRELGCNARRHAEGYTWEAAAARMDAVLRQIGA